MAKARMLGMKTGFTPNSQADRLRCDKAYRRGRKVERQYQKNASDKRELSKLAADLNTALVSINWAELPRDLVIAVLEGDPRTVRKENPYEAR